MSAAKLAEVAVLMWSGILGAMKADGIIANCVTQAGPNTGKFLQMLALDNVMKEPGLTWIPVAIGPNPSCEVFAISTRRPQWKGDLLCWHADQGMWLTRDGQVVQDVTHYLVIPPHDNGSMVPQ